MKVRFLKDVEFSEGGLQEDSGQRKGYQGQRQDFPGDQADIPDDLAKHWIDMGVCEEVKPKAPKASSAPKAP